MISDPKNELTFVQALAAQAKTASFNVTGIDLSQYVGQIAVVIDVGTVSGTTPTLSVDLQSGDANDGSNAVAFTPDVVSSSITASGMQVLSFDKRAAGRYLKIVSTIGGTTPSFTFGVTVVARKRSQP